MNRFFAPCGDFWRFCLFLNKIRAEIAINAHHAHYKIIISLRYKTVNPMTTHFTKKRQQYSRPREGEKLCKKTQGAKVEKSGAVGPQGDVIYKGQQT